MENISKNIEQRYYEHVDDLIFYRSKIIIAIAIVLYLIFFPIDLIAYPSSAFIFLNIRIFVSLACLIVILLSFNTKLKRFAVWFAISAGVFLQIGVCIMTYITNGSSSLYYQGINLQFLGMCVINPFYLRHMIFFYLSGIVLFNIAMIANPGSFNSLNFIFANFFMISTCAISIVLTIFYKNQHYNAFVRAEQLKINEKILTDLFTQADKLSKTDSLTEINNRRQFSDLLNKKMESCEKSKAPFYLIIFDVDYFKIVNDNYGHAFGDQVLVKLVEVVKKNIRFNDFIGRFGGDEFIICLNYPVKEGLLNRLIKIRSAIHDLRLTHNGKIVPISISIGAAKYLPQTGMTEKSLMEKTDAELLKVKNSARGEISINE